MSRSRSYPIEDRGAFLGAIRAATGSRRSRTGARGLVTVEEMVASIRVQWRGRSRLESYEALKRAIALALPLESDRTRGFVAAQLRDWVVRK